MNAAIHTHEMFDNDITVDARTDKRYTSLRIVSTVYPRGVTDDTFVLPSEFVLHMGGLTITEAEKFITQGLVAFADLLAWNDDRKAAENEDVAS